MIRLLALLAAVPSALALPTPSLSLSPRAYFENSIVTNPSALAWYEAPTTNGAGAGAAFAETTTGGGGSGSTSAYHCYTSATYPAIAAWPPFATLWTSASGAIAARNGGSTTTTQLLRDKILLVAAATSVDARLILATVLQESGGALAAPCTGDAAAANCGIMQAAPGSRPYDAGDPAGSVEGMLRDGVQGVAGSWPAGGPGLAYWLGEWGRPWEALRAYNTGSVPDGGDLRQTGGVGTASYVVDVANRLVGWDGVSRGSC